MSDIKDFINTIKKANCKRKITVRNSYGVRDYYKHYRKLIGDNKRLFITELQYFKILKNINKLLAEHFYTLGTLKFPAQMGELELRKTEAKFKLINNKVKTNLSVDWGKTIELWYEDEESYRLKRLVRNTNKDIYKIVYNKSRARYKNRSYFKFLVNRNLKHLISQNIKENKLDSFTF